MINGGIINTGAAAACTTDTVQILGGTSCIAYYKMSDATDETGSYDGTPSNVNFNVAGKFGNAGEFNGSSSKINTGVTNAFDLQTFSVSAWINVNNSSSQTFVCNFGTASQPNGLGWTFGINGSGQLYFSDAYGAGVAGSVLATNIWIHVVSVCNVSTGEQTIYLNSQQDATRNNYSGIVYVAGGFPAGSRRLIIGELGGNNAAWLNGSIDQVRIFNRAITANEVTTLYDEVQCIPTIVPTDNFNPVLFTPTTSTSTLPVTGVGFQPDFVWAKYRNGVQNHYLFDSIRGGYLLRSNTTDAELTGTVYMDSFDPDGFTTVNNLFNRTETDSVVAWNWKAGGPDVLNQDGTIDSQVSANVEAGFSIVKWTGDGTNATIGHGLSSTPEMIIVKPLDNQTSGNDWKVYHSALGNLKVIYLNLTVTPDNVTSSFWGTINDDVFGQGGADVGYLNILNYDYIAYCFHSVDGMSKFGSYVGTGAAGNTIVTGFRPAFMLFRAADIAFPWELVDNKRPDGELRANNSDAERIENTPDFLQNGFRLTTERYNNAGQKFIFMAFAEEVFVPEIPFEGGDFNGLEYQLVTNPTTGRTWLDRNLGATRVAISQNDSAAFGYYYQWGRLSDGHQIPTSSTTSTLSGSDVPGNSNFITSTVSPKDWRSPQNSTLWQGPQSYNNPCPPGFRVPTEAEIEEETLSWGSQNSAGAFASNLKLPTGSGIRIETGGAPVDTGAGYLWTSTISGTDAKFYYVAGGGDFTSNYRRAAACPVRPIKDE